jgi:hypothetical protein
MMASNDYLRKLVDSWRWVIEVFCTGLVVWFWAWNFTTSTLTARAIEGDIVGGGSWLMMLLFFTSLASWRHHRRHSFFGLLVAVAWFVSVLFFPPIYT